MFIAAGVASSAIRKITNSFFFMLAANRGRAMFMTAVAGVLGKIASLVAVFTGLGVVAVKPEIVCMFKGCRFKGIGAMASATI